MAGHDELNAAIRRGAGITPPRPEEVDDPRAAAAPADIDQAARGERRPVVDANAWLRRLLGRDPFPEHRWRG